MNVRVRRVNNGSDVAALHWLLMHTSPAALSQLNSQRLELMETADKHMAPLAWATKQIGIGKPLRMRCCRV
jgi:hypothetical protein